MNYEKSETAENTQSLTATKWSLWIVAWIVVALAMGNNSLAPQFFPLGLFTIFVSAEQGIKICMMGIFPKLIGWTIYAVLSLAMFRTNKRAVFFGFYTLFCILLILNVAGCHKTLEAANGIH